MWAQLFNSNCCFFTVWYTEYNKHYCTEALEAQINFVSIYNIYMDTLFLNEHRCQCGKLLLKGIFFDGVLEIECKRCGEINKIGSIKLAADATHYLLIINDKGIIINVSDSACRILGYTQDEFIGKCFIQIYPAMSKEIGKIFFGPESVLNEENYFRFDTIHQSKDGRKISIIIFLKLYQPTVKEKYLLLSARLKDVVNGKKTFDKNALDFLDNTCNFYFDIDRNGINEYMSQSMESFFGYFQKMLIGKNYFDYLPAEIRVKSKKTFKYFSVNEQPYRVVHNVGIGANGKAIHTELYFTPKFDDGGKFVGYCVLGWVVNNPRSVDNSCF